MVEYARDEYDPFKYNEVIFCGGDGIIHEFLNISFNNNK